VEASARYFGAFDSTVGRMVAIKVLAAQGGEPDLLIRFRNEAAAAGRLQHRNIVTIHDFGEQGGTPYVVMELLDGEDLQRLIARNSCWPTALRRSWILESPS